MPPTATLEDIKAHQQKIEKSKITPDNLPRVHAAMLNQRFSRFTHTVNGGF